MVTVYRLKRSGKRQLADMLAVTSFHGATRIDGSMANYKLSGDPFDNGEYSSWLLQWQPGNVNQDYSNGGEKVNHLLIRKTYLTFMMSLEM